MTAAIRLLPHRQEDLAQSLGVSVGTLCGWMQVADGRTLSPRSPGRRPPSDELMARMLVLLLEHGKEVEAVAAGFITGIAGEVKS